MKTDMNIHPVNFDRNHYCGPAAISSLTGMKTSEAARLIRSTPGRGNGGVRLVKNYQMVWALYQCGLKARRLLMYRDKSKRPTLAQWLRDSKDTRTPGRVYMISAGKHLQIIMGDRYVCGLVREIVSINHLEVKRRARVRTVWEITKNRSSS